MASLPWLRLYHRIIDDEKIRLLAFEDRWHFVALLCLKANGVLDTKDKTLRQRKMAVKMGLQLREVDEVLRRLNEVGLVDKKGHPCAWDELQFTSDSSTERVRRHRESKKGNGGETLQQRSGNAPETETETETEEETDTEKNKSNRKRFVKPSVEEVWEYCKERGNDIDPESFVDHYESNGWRVGGKSPMKDWKASVRTWERNRKQEASSEPRSRAQRAGQ